MNLSLSRVILSNTEHLHPLRFFVSAAAKQFGFSDDECSNIVLAVDEACTNIIRHAYHGERNREIEIVIEGNGKQFDIHIYDSGDTFDPESLRPVNLRKYVSSFKRGGLGVYLMKALMDGIEYRSSHHGKNEVLLTKHLNPT